MSGPGDGTPDQEEAPDEPATVGSMDAPVCDLCGAPMRETHCKLICDRCGYVRDCSDP